MSQGDDQLECDMASSETWTIEVPETGRWAEGVTLLGAIDGDDEYGCDICKRGPTGYFKYLTVHRSIWYASSGFVGYLCRHCSLGMARAFQVQTLMRGWRSVLALPLAALMMIANAITLRAGRAQLPHPEPAHEAADEVLEGAPLVHRPVFLGMVMITAAAALTVAPSLVL